MMKQEELAELRIGRMYGQENRARDASRAESGECLRAMRAMEEAIRAVEKLADERERMKLSNSRVTGVGKELKDLFKVLVLATS